LPPVPRRFGIWVSGDGSATDAGQRRRDRPSWRRYLAKWAVFGTREFLTWLTDALERRLQAAPGANEIERLLPWAWKAKELAAAAHAQTP
jgi:hypothetical protein